MDSAFHITSPPLLLAGTNRESLTATGLIPIIDSEMESIKEFEGNNSLLTQSQQTRLQLYLGNFNELKECLDKLIVINVENPAQLQRLFNLWEKIVEAIAILSQYSQNEIQEAEEPKTKEEKKEEVELEVTLIEEPMKEEEKEPKELDDKFDNLSLYDSQMLKVSQLGEIFVPNFEEDFQEEIKIEAPIEVKKIPDGFECPICGEPDLPEEDIFTFTTCGHNYCKLCLVNYIRVKIESGEVRKTCCPDLHCGIDISEEDVERLLPVDLFGKFQRFLFLDRLRENENARWCPKPDCNFTIVVDDTIRYSSAFPKLTCGNCETEFCFNCSEIWHEGLPCNSVKSKSSKKELAKLNKWKKKHSQPCKKCHANVEKNGGCNHMTCRCGYQWCWICGDEYQWQHYYEGKCKGLHVSEHPGFDRAIKRGKKAGKIGAVGAGVVIATPIVVGAGLIALGLAVPVACVAVPIGGAYYIKKKRDSRKNRWRK